MIGWIYSIYGLLYRVKIVFRSSWIEDPLNLKIKILLHYRYIYIYCKYIYNLIHSAYQTNKQATKQSIDRFLIWF
jgi:hypothetical protein